MDDKPRIAGSLLLLLMTLSAWGTEQRVVPLGDDVRIEVEASDASVEVVTHQRPELIIESPDLPQLSVDRQGGVVSIKSAEPGPRRLRLTVRPDVQLNVSGADSEISVRGVRGPVTIRNHTQPITVEDIRGAVDVGSLTGPITIRNVQGNVGAESNTNAIDVAGVIGDVRARSTTSSVTVTASRSTVVELQSVSGIVTFVGEIPRKARYRLGTHSGEVILQVPSQSDATILLHGRPTAFAIKGATVEMTEDEIGRIQLGDGRARVVAESVLGAIRVTVSPSPGLESSD